MLDMETTRALISFVGMRDPYPENEEEAGPLLALILDREKAGKPFDEAWLLCTGGAFLERAKDLEREAREEGARIRFHPIDFPVKDVIDYSEIWDLLGRTLSLIRERAGAVPRDWTFLLDSGTPQMKTSLFLAARSGLFPARLVQGIPPRFAGGSYKCREVRVEGMPEIGISASGVRESRERESRDAVSAISPAPVRKSVPPKPRDAVLGEGIVVGSPAFEATLQRAVSAARFDEPVLILGETGTGKTLVAKRIHEESSRRGGPFVEVNCSAIPASMAESELFGHEQGAFTGADKARTGKIRTASGGTLFLDEVGDLPPDVQAKLLKALEEKTVTPVGSDTPEPVDVRFVAATNRHLPGMIKEGTFRRDLYERLKVVTVTIPALRERREGVRPLAAYFLSEMNEKYNDDHFLTEDALVLLESYSWPGNVRELKNAITSAACTAATAALGPEALPEEVRRSRDGARGESSDGSALELPEDGINLRARLLQVEWQYVSAALRRTGGNREAAARLLGMEGHTFRKAMRERFSAFLDEGWEGEM